MQRTSRITAAVATLGLAIAAGLVAAPAAHADPAPTLVAAQVVRTVGGVRPTGVPNGYQHLLLSVDPNDPVAPECLLWLPSTNTVKWAVNFYGVSAFIIEDGIFGRGDYCTIGVTTLLEQRAPMDGNLVLYTPPGKAGWAMSWRNPSAVNAAYAEFQGLDGNLVSYDDAGRAVGATDTSSHDEQRFLAIQSDGNVVIYGGDPEDFTVNHPVRFQTYTSVLGAGSAQGTSADTVTTESLPVSADAVSHPGYSHVRVSINGSRIKPECHLWIPTDSTGPALRSYFGVRGWLITDAIFDRGDFCTLGVTTLLEQQPPMDGNLVLYSPRGRASWAMSWRNSLAVNGSYVRFQTDGNLVSYDAQGRAVGATDTASTEHRYLAIQSDGNVVIYGGNEQYYQTANPVRFQTGTTRY